MYMCCEWALKNYLYVRYEKQYADHEIPEYTKTYRIDQLSAKTATLYFLLDELEDYGIPAPETAGINKQRILKNADAVNNKPKHEGKIPDPKLYKVSLEEVRKIIRCYVDKSADLEVIEDSVYGDGQAWYEVLENTSEFDERYSYMLITDRLNGEKVRGLFSIKWDLVIDMDPESDMDGLASKYTSFTGITPNMRTLDRGSARTKFSYSHKPYWVMANGTADNSKSVAITKMWGTYNEPIISDKKSLILSWISPTILSVKGDQLMARKQHTPEEKARL